MGLPFVMSLHSSGLRCNDFVSGLHPRDTPGIRIFRSPVCIIFSRDSEP
jgi:hypothetical protein